MGLTFTVPLACQNERKPTVTSSNPRTPRVASDLGACRLTLRETTCDEAGRELESCRARQVAELREILRQGRQPGIETSLRLQKLKGQHSYLSTGAGVQR
jgi:hypothetical protein